MHVRIIQPFIIYQSDAKLNKLHPLNLLFIQIITLSFLGAFTARALGHGQDQVRSFLKMFYNSFGALIFPVTSCWIIDFLELIYIYYKY